MVQAVIRRLKTQHFPFLLNLKWTKHWAQSSCGAATGNTFTTGNSDSHSILTKQDSVSCSSNHQTIICTLLVNSLATRKFHPVPLSPAPLYRKCVMSQRAPHRYLSLVSDNETLFLSSSKHVNVPTKHQFLQEDILVLWQAVNRGLKMPNILFSGDLLRLFGWFQNKDLKWASYGAFN